MRVTRHDRKYIFGRPCGPWPTEPRCVSDAEYAPVLGRKLAFPLHLSLSTYPLEACTRGYEPGRVLIVSESGSEGLFRPDIFEAAQTQDVVFARLYEGTQHQEGPWPIEPTAAFDHNCTVLKDLAPQVRVILVGNRYAEAGCLQSITEPSDELALQSSERICALVRKAGGTIRSLGGRPAFGLIGFQGYMDCYRIPGQPLRAALQEVGALVIFFLGFRAWPWLSPILVDDPHGRIVPRHLLDDRPYPKWTQWLSGLECWGGVNYLQGLRNGNDIRMSNGGYKAGVIGQLPDGSM